MTPVITELNYNEILMYLGHRGQEPDEELKQQINRCVELILEKATPRIVHRRMPVTEGSIEGFAVESSDLSRILENCSEAVLMAATLGPQVEQLMMRYEVTDMADAVIMDAAASAAIENLCDNFEFALRDELEAEGLYLSDRFSPGYGDFSIEYQRNLCDAVDASRRIGLTVSARNLLIPRKSVTAVLGISTGEFKLRKRGCEVCSMFMTCSYRTQGKGCGGKDE